MPEFNQIQSPIKPDQIIEIILRRKWLIIVSLCVTLTLGVYETFTLPRTYEASTSILVQAQRVPGNYVKSIVSIGINERISTISQQILSQSNIEKIIDQFGLFDDEDAINMYLEDKIKSMRKRIKINLTRARSGTDSFKISFTGKNPERVMRVANTLASFFMDENLKVREAQAVGTSEFLESELGKTRKRLEETEQRLSEYRSRYMGGLPDELESNLRTLDRLQEQLTNKQIALKDAKAALGTLEMQINQAQNMAASQGGMDQFMFDDFGDESVEGSANQAKLKKARQIMDNLLLRYTEKHPDVRKLKKTIEKLESLIAQEEKAAAEEEAQVAEDGMGGIQADGEDPDMEGGDEILPVENFAAMQQEAQLNQAKNEIAKLKDDISIIEKKMKLYQQRVEDTPKREQELLSLKRDYNNVQDIYNSLLDRKLEAELAVNMEKKQKGEQFRILDHARLPEKPISPDVKLLFLISLAGGLGFAGGIIFLLELFDTSIRRDEDIEKGLGLTILAAIPPLKKPGDQMKKKLDWIFFSLAVLYAAGLLGIFAVVNMKGIERVITFIKSFI